MIFLCTEIYQDTMPVPGDQHVARLDVEMRQLRTMQVLKGKEQRLKEGANMAPTFLEAGAKGQGQRLTILVEVRARDPIPDKPAVLTPL